MAAASFLLCHFDRLAEAPGGIAKLRALTLQLAVTGKLLSQNKSDEPVAKLLVRIRTEKTRLTKKPVASAPIDRSEVQVEIPAEWEWIKLGDLCSKTGSGSTPRGGKTAYSNSGIPFLRSQNVYDDGLRLDGVAYITSEIHAQMSGTVVVPGDLLLNITGGSIGRCAIVPDPFTEGNVSQHVAILRPAIADMSDYLHLVVLSPHFQTVMLGSQTGAGREGLPKNRMDEILIPLPPLAEQRRIVAKVEELMGLCDALEAAQQERETVRTRLRTSALHQLASAGSDSKSAAFVFDHLPLFTTESDDLASLRQSVLQFAVSGKFSADATVNERNKRSVDPLSPIEEGDNASTDILPSSWRWAYLKEVCDLITDGTHLTPRYTPSGRIFLSAQNVKPFRFMPAKHRFVSEEDYQGYVKNRKPTLGDVLLTRVGAGIGEAAVIDQEIDFAIYVSLGLVRPTSALLIPEFLTMWLNSPAGRSYSSTNTLGKGASQGNLNLGLIRKFVIPLPPLAEQRRIVAKVDELMAVLDALEATLTTTRTTAEKLLAATIAKLHAA